MCDFMLLKGNMINPKLWLLARFAFWVKCLESALDPQLHSLRASPFNQGLFLCFVRDGVCFRTENESQVLIITLKRSRRFLQTYWVVPVKSISRTSYASNFFKSFFFNVKTSFRPKCESTQDFIFWLCCLWFFPRLWFKLSKCNWNKALTYFDTR